MPEVLSKYKNKKSNYKIIIRFLINYLKYMRNPRYLTKLFVV